MDNQAKDLRLEKDKKKLWQTRKEKSAKRQMKNERWKETKEASSWRKQDLRIACKNFICSSFFNLKVNLAFVILQCGNGCHSSILEHGCGYYFMTAVTIDH